ncbi:MAG TPA: transporter [Pseudolabrys sp.]
MTYVAGDIPVGRYDSGRLANLGLGHSAVDAGGGYTYFNRQTGWEFSSVLGFTFNFENEHADYQNGVDMHLDLSASRFVTKQLQLGVVGYAYRQISCDSGGGDLVGCFESQVFGIGPQIGYIIPMGDLQGYLNIKAYKEFGAEHRAEGWNTWVALGDFGQATSGANKTAIYEMTARHGARPGPPQISRPSTFSESDFTRSGMRWRRG